MEKIIKTDFKEYDYMTKYEEIIKNNPNFLEYSIMHKNAPTPKEKKLYLLAIITILYKEQSYQSYFDSISNRFKIQNFKKEIELELYEQLTDELENSNFKNIYIILLQNKNKITKSINLYFERKNMNYIQSKKIIERIQPNTKNIIKLNPLVINQLMNYYQNPLTQQEKIIGDILDFFTVADSLTHHNDLKSLEKIKDLIIHNYEQQELFDVIMFIVSNIYQETMANEQDPNRKLMKDLMENEGVCTNEKIIKTFLVSDDFSNMILSSFLYYNKNIKEGRLAELKQHPSYEFIKKRIQK